jgi:hypothetical protein
MTRDLCSIESCAILPRSVQENPADIAEGVYPMHALSVDPFNAL